MPATVNVKIRTGHTVLLNNDLPDKPIKNLTLEEGSRLFTNDSTINANRYLTVYGNILCNGNIGNGFNKYDNVSFNVEGTNCTISGSGTFNCGRIRKNSISNAITRLTFAMSVGIKYGSGTGRGCGLYNNANGNSEFSISLNANCNLDLLAPLNEMADFSLDGTDGEAPQQRYGNLIVSGNMNVAGTIYALTNNLSQPIAIEIEPNGKLSCFSICTANAGSLNASVHQGSNSGGSTLRVKSRGTLEISGGNPLNSSIYNLGFCIRNSINWPGNFFSGIGLQNSTFDFQAGSTVVYSGKTGKLAVQAEGLVYANLTLTNNGKKGIVDTLRVLENLSILSPSVFNPQNHLIYLGGNWVNYNQAGLSEGTSTVIFNGSNNQLISNIVGEVFYNISLQNPNAVDLLSDLQIRNQLEMQGNLNAGAQTVTLGESSMQKGNLIYQNGRIIGKMKRWFGAEENFGPESGLFPIGNNQYDQFVTVEFTSAPIAGGTLTAEFVPQDMAMFGVPANPYFIASNGSCSEFTASNLSAQGFWKIDDADGLNSGIYNVTLDIEGITDIIDPCYLTALKRVGNGIWEESGMHVFGSGTANRPIVKREGASGWSNWGIAAGAMNPLPIELLEFNAQAKDSWVELNWTTASELNNASFVIERSVDLTNFESLITTPGAGNSNVVLAYQEFDKNPFEGISYYRLKQIDYNGQFTYSEIKPVNFSSEDKLRINYWAIDNGNLRLNLHSSEDFIEITVYDISGRMIDYSVFSNSNEDFIIDLQAVSKGLYLISVNNRKSSIHQKIFR
jgi:hypothetical protein